MKIISCSYKGCVEPPREPAASGPIPKYCTKHSCPSSRRGSPTPTHRPTQCETCGGHIHNQIKPGAKGRPRLHCSDCADRRYGKGKLRTLQRAARDRLGAHKSGPCLDCGQTYPPFVMDFDHRDPAEKSFSISQAVRGGMSEAAWDRVETEIAKCDLVCANCHRIRTHSKD